MFDSQPNAARAREGGVYNIIIKVQHLKQAVSIAFDINDFIVHFSFYCTDFNVWGGLGMCALQVREEKKGRENCPCPFSCW